MSAPNKQKNTWHSMTPPEVMHRSWDSRLALKSHNCNNVELVGINLRVTTRSNSPCYLPHEYDCRSSVNTQSLSWSIIIHRTDKQSNISVARMKFEDCYGMRCAGITWASVRYCEVSFLFICAVLCLEWPHCFVSVIQKTNRSVLDCIRFRL